MASLPFRTVNGLSRAILSRVAQNSRTLLFFSGTFFFMFQTAVGLLGFWIGLAAASFAQQPATTSADLAKIAQSGFIDDGKYQNSILQLAIDVPDAQAATSAASGEKLVRIAEITSAPNVSDKFAIAVLVDTLNSYPDLKSPEPYVRSVAHQFQAQGFSLIHEEPSRMIDGVSFSAAVMQVPDSQKRKSFACCYRGFYSAFRFGYIVTFVVEATSEPRLNELVSTRVHFGPTSLNFSSGAIGSGEGPPASPGNVLKPGLGGVKPPRVKFQTEPQIPDAHRNGFKEGTVVVRGIIGIDGRLHSARVTRSLSPGYDAKALDALKQWTFQPAEKDGQKVPVIIDIEVKFRLSD